MRAALAAIISEQVGEGESSMLAFVRQQLQWILQPFADHVQELHDAVTELTKRIEASDATHREHQDQFDKYEAVITQVRAENDVIHGEVMNLRALHELRSSENQECLNESRRQAVVLRELEQRMTSGESSVLDLRRGLNNTDNLVDQLRRDMSETEEKLAEVKRLEVSLDELRQTVTELFIAHQESRRLIGDNVNEIENTNTRMQKFYQKVEDLNRRDMQKIDFVGKSMHDLATQFKDMECRHNANSHQLKSLTNVVGKMKTRISEMDNTQKALAATEGETARCVTETAARVHSVESTIADFQKLSRKSGGGLVGGASVGGLLSKLEETTANLKSLEEKVATNKSTMEGHVQRIERCELRTSNLEKEQARFNDRTTKLQDRLSANESIFVQLQTALYQNEVQKAWNKDVEYRIDQLQKEHDFSASCIKDMQSELTDAGNDITKLKCGLELTHEYWKGLSKGFQETHRYVAFEHEMLPPKGLHAALPGIPKTTTPAPGTPKPTPPPVRSRIYQPSHPSDP